MAHTQNDIAHRSPLDAGVRISMDGKGRWRENLFIERLWRSLKYEEVYLTAYDTIPQAEKASATG